MQIKMRLTLFVRLSAWGDDNTDYVAELDGVWELDLERSLSFSALVENYWRAEQAKDPKKVTDEFIKELVHDLNKGSILVVSIKNGVAYEFTRARINKSPDKDPLKLEEKRASFRIFGVDKNIIKANWAYPGSDDRHNIYYTYVFTGKDVLTITNINREDLVKAPAGTRYFNRLSRDPFAYKTFLNRIKE